MSRKFFLRQCCDGIGIEKSAAEEKWSEIKQKVIDALIEQNAQRTFPNLSAMESL